MKKTIISVIVSFLILAPSAWPREYTGSDPLTGAGTARARETDRRKKDKTEKMGRLAEEINILFLKGDYKAVVQKADASLKNSWIDKDEKKEILYLAGLSYIKLNDFKKAREAFTRILEMADGAFKEKAHIGIADSYFYEKKFEEKGLDIKSASAEETGVYYVVQLGMFKSHKNAQSLARRLARKHYKTYIQKIRQNGSRLYRILGGKFSTRLNAVRLCKKLKKSGFAAKIIEE
jgi:tetratricopeptide (TPR) repeat protein